ncbi:hypothetical protein CANMA_004888 [Candida margitis]|uniref:uncharacterized protein n=1 Tax=Candida margitis TaxID=1775924 RepID=UPI0022272242|nr:uncharacterized protein CANMA_004888 [Candida margitis]KAI5954049.1 hypothetical protein CANMA_004888 [Candida margitis]
MTDRDEERYRLENDITTTSATATSPHLGSVFDTPNNAPTSSTFGTSPQTENNKVRAREAQLRLKQELVDEKQRLLKIKAEKLNQIETLQTRVEQLSKVQKETNIKNQLNELLEKSQVEFYKRLQSRNQQQQDYMLQHLNVLPSADWDQRLSLAKKFIPFLDIDKLKTYNEYFDDKLIRVFEFTILSPLVLNLRLKLDINTSDDSVFQISVVTNLTTLHMLSSSFARALVDDYTPNGKINCIMYGLNSLTRLIQKRTKIWHQLVIKYKSLIQNDRLANISAQVSDYTKLRYCNFKRCWLTIHIVDSKVWSCQFIRNYSL